MAEVPLATPVQLEMAISAAVQATADVGALPTHQRVEILERTAALLARDAAQLATQICREAAKPIAFARGEVARAQQTFRFAASELTSHRGDVIPMDAAAGGNDKWALTRRFPVGPVAAITPFNFPLNLVAHKLAPAIAAGCPIVIKPANKTPLSALALGRLVLEAGWPEQALSVLNLPIEDSAPLVEDERFRLLTFTGSGRVGWAMRARAGRKRVLLELGGDAAVIVAADAGEDPAAWDRMVQRIAFGAFAYAGQVCISVQRVLVHSSLYDRFVADIARVTTDTIGVGAPTESGVVVSSLIDDHAAAKVSRILDDTMSRGAVLQCGGDRSGRLIAPCVVTDVPPDSLFAVEEVFGPAVAVSRYETLDEAIGRVNRSRFGLQAGVYTSHLPTITRAFEGLEVGGVMIDEVPTFRVDHMPYGGVKESGFGREGLRYAYEEYTDERLLVLPRG